MTAAVVDYGMGNLRSVVQALRAVGAEPIVSSDPAVIHSAERIVLPGVGAFAEAAARLRRLGLDSVLQSAAKSGTPVLGICLGMQLLLDESEEFGRYSGLGLIHGRAVPFAGPHMTGLRIPHTGWNIVEPAAASFLDRLGDPYMYFVHSFHAIDVPEPNVAARSSYGVPFTCAVQRGNIWGTQFHPEKSGQAGLEVLRRFAAADVENFTGGVDNHDHLSRG